MELRFPLPIQQRCRSSRLVSVSSANFTEQYCAPQELFNRVHRIAPVDWRDALESGSLEGPPVGRASCQWRLGPIIRWIRRTSVRNRSAAKPARASEFFSSVPDVYVIDCRSIPASRQDRMTTRRNIRASLPALQQTCSDRMSYGSAK